jgi:hypothetical protein
MGEPKEGVDKEAARAKFREMIADLEGLVGKLKASQKSLEDARARNQDTIDSAHAKDGRTRTMAASQDAHANRVESLLESILDLTAANLEAQLTTTEMARVQLTQGLASMSVEFEEEE